MSRFDEHLLMSRERDAYLFRRCEGRRLKLFGRTTLPGNSRSLVGAGKTIGRLLTPNGPLRACTPRVATLRGISGMIGVLIGRTVPRGRFRRPAGDDGNGFPRPRLNMEGGGGGGLLLRPRGGSRTGGVSITFSSAGASPNN